MSLTDYVPKRRRNGAEPQPMMPPPVPLQLAADNLLEAERNYRSGIEDLRTQVQQVVAENESLRKLNYRLEADLDVMTQVAKAILDLMTEMRRPVPQAEDAPAIAPRPESTRTTCCRRSSARGRQRRRRHDRD